MTPIRCGIYGKFRTVDDGYSRNIKELESRIGNREACRAYLFELARGRKVFDVLNAREGMAFSRGASCMRRLRSSDVGHCGSDPPRYADAIDRRSKIEDRIGSGQNDGLGLKRTRLLLWASREAWLWGLNLNSKDSRMWWQNLRRAAVGIGKVKSPACVTIPAIQNGKSSATNLISLNAGPGIKPWVAASRFVAAAWFDCLFGVAALLAAFVLWLLRFFCQNAAVETSSRAAEGSSLGSPGSSLAGRRPWPERSSFAAGHLVVCPRSRQPWWLYSARR